MKRMTCEICGSTDLMKQEGAFVCQSCGCKYSLEEARKLMAESPDGAPASGTPEGNKGSLPGNTENTGGTNTRLDNLRELAKRAKDSNDSENAAKYYGQILLEDPNDWRANFYSVFFASHNIKIAQIGSAAVRVTNCFEPVLNLIRKNEGPVSQKLACSEIVTQVAAFELMLVNNASNHPGSTLEALQNNINNWVVPSLSMLLILGEKLESKFQDYALAESLYDSVRKQAGAIGSMTAEIGKTAALAASKLANARKAKERKAKEEKEEKERKEKQARVDKYWSEHAEEKEKLEAEQAGLKTKADELYSKIRAIDTVNETKIRALESRRYLSVPTEAEVGKQQSIVYNLEQQFKALGIFKGKEKKELRQRLDSIEKPQLEKLRAAARDEKEERNREIDRQIAELKEDGKELRTEYGGLKTRLDEIKDELTKDR